MNRNPLTEKSTRALGVIDRIKSKNQIRFEIFAVQTGSLQPVLTSPVEQ